ncbi:MAG: recombination mediator RecR [Candidatus Eisenbacteria bacterium]|nr:recombination mediator RecR [Candidatus Eisenbacteria bacterium]
MQYSSRIVEQLVEELARLPGIGKKTAQRLAFHLLRTSREEALRLSDAVRALKERVDACTICGNITEEEPCLICRDPRRDKDVICVVETPVDVVAVEQSGAFRGQYHVLGGAINPLDNVGPDDIRAHELVERVRMHPTREVILATNPNPAGEVTASYLAELLGPSGVIVTRIARGVPVGSDIEYSDQATLARALEGRKGLS